MMYDVTISLPSTYFEVAANSPAEAVAIAFDKVVKGEEEIYFTVKQQELIEEDY